MTNNIVKPSRRRSAFMKGTLAVAITAGLTLAALPATAAPTAPSPRAALDINNLPPVVGDIYNGVNDPNVPHVGQGFELSIDGIPGYWAGAYAQAAGVPANWSTALWWCISAGPYQANNLTNVQEVNAPDYAYALSKYQSVDTVNSRAALSAIGHIKYDVGHEGFSKADMRATWGREFSAQAPAAFALMNQYLAEGEKFAGPYSTTGFAVKEIKNGNDPVLTADGKRQYEVSGIGVKSAKGNFVAGHKIDVALTGPLQWADGGTTASFTSTEAGQKKIAIGVGNGTGTANMKVAKTLPNSTIIMGTQVSHQTMVSMPLGNLVDASGSSSVEVIMNFTPEATSKVADKIVDDNKIGDTLTVKAAAGETWLKDSSGKFVPVTFTGTAYSAGTLPVDSTKAAPSGAKVIGTQKIVADKGPGTYGPVYLDKVDPQMVTWVWEVTEAAQTKSSLTFIKTGWKDSYGLADETTSVRNPLNIDSDLSIRETKTGVYLVDDQWRTGFQKDHTKFTGKAGFKADVNIIENDLHFIPGEDLPTGTSCTPDTLVASETTEATNGFEMVGAPSFKIDDSKGVGTYVVVHRFAGDDRVQPYTSPCDDPAQQFLVRAPEREITVTTQIQPSTDKPIAGDGGNLKDTHLITGEILPGDKGTSNLYLIPEGQEMKCTPENLVWTTDVLDYANAEKQADGSYTITSKGYEYGDKGGTYTFVEEAVNAEGQVIARGVCGNPTETIVVQPKPVPAAPVVALTGANAAITAGVAFALLAGGSALMIVRRKRTN